MERRKQRKDKVIRVRVSEIEHGIFRAKAIAGGYRTVSDYIRSLIHNPSENTHRMQ